MKAIQISEYGDSNVLLSKELPIPQPGRGEALIRLKAAGLNFIDIYMRTGYYPVPLPFVPGREGAGIVEAIGEGVTEVKVGDRVAYVGSLGSYAEYQLINAWQLIPLPNDISFEQGAAFPLQGITAQYLLHEYYAITPGTKVLVHAAAGGVGLLLVQWLKHMGAEVFGTVSSEEKAAMAKKAGADHIIFYTKQDFVEEIKTITREKGVDYIIDGVGKTTFTKDLDAVRKRGCICIFGSASGPAEPIVPNSLQAKSLTICGGSLFNYIDNRPELLNRAQAVLNGLRAGWLQLTIDHVFSLEEAALAQSMLEERKTMGKVVLQIG